MIALGSLAKAVQPDLNHDCNQAIGQVNFNLVDLAPKTTREVLTVTIDSMKGYRKDIVMKRGNTR